MNRVAVLYARADSVYKAIPGLDVYDMERDARTYAGTLPVVAHPPCRVWGNLRHFAKPRPDEADLGRHAVAQVHRCGGVLEHPKRSRLWDDQGLPMPGKGRDAFGGFSLQIPQYWFGHLAHKETLLYVCGCEPGDVPAYPMKLGEPDRFVEKLSKAQRERTPPDFANWLVDLAARCRPLSPR